MNSIANNDDNIKSNNNNNSNNSDSVLTSLLSPINEQNASSSSTSSSSSYTTFPPNNSSSNKVVTPSSTTSSLAQHSTSSSQLYDDLSQSTNNSGLSFGVDGGGGGAIVGAIGVVKRDSNELHRHLTLVDLISIGVASTVGSGIFVLCGLIAHDYAGPSTFICWGVAGLSCCASGLCYAELSGKFSVSGSTYSYVVSFIYISIYHIHRLTHYYDWCDDCIIFPMLLIVMGVFVWNDTYIQTYIQTCIHNIYLYI